MPSNETRRRAARDKREGKSASTQAGEFVREEMDHIRQGKHGASSTKQAIAIGLSKARRSGVALAPPKRGTTAAETRGKAVRDRARGSSTGRKRPNARRAAATAGALKREPRRAATHTALSAQARSAARRRTPAQRSKAARRAVRTKGRRARSAAARRAARSRKSHAASPP